MCLLLEEMTVDKTINLVILYSGNIQALNGASKFVKTFDLQRELYKKNNINVCILSDSNSFTSEVEYKKTIKHKFRQGVKKTLFSTRFGTNLGHYYMMKSTGMRIVKEFGKHNYSPYNTVVLLNDFFVAAKFYETYGNKYKTIQLLHNDGTILGMIEDQMLHVGKIWKDFKKYEYLMRQYTTQFVCVSKPSVNNFKHRYNQENVKCIYIGQESKPTTKLSTDHLYMVCVGTICKRKNQISLIRAIHTINNPTIKLVLIGDGPEKQNCEDYVKKHNLSNQIAFLGAKNDVFEYLKNSNVFVLVSKDEGLPISAQEAMNSGLPLIMTDVGGCSELIDGNGLLIACDDNSIEKAITWFEENLHMIPELGKKSKVLFEEKYTYEKMVDNYSSMIKELLYLNTRGENDD